MPASRWGSAPGLWRRRLLLRQVEKRIQGFPVVAGENRAPAIRRITRGASARRVLAPGWGSAPACQLRVLLLRQVEKRIDGFAVVAGENRAPAIRRITRGASARRVLAPGWGSAPACQLRVLLLRQVEKRIDGFAVVADLEMQLVAVGAGAAHLGDLLARLHPLALGYQALAVVAVGRQPLFVVLDDDQLAIAHQARARIDHDAVGGRVHRLAGGAADVDTLAGG